MTLWQKKLGVEPAAFSLCFSGQKEVNAGSEACMKWEKNIDFSGLIFHPCDLAEKQCSRDMIFLRMSRNLS